MKTIRLSALVLLVSMLGLTGCGRHRHKGEVLQPPRAKSATVQFRRDLLGGSSALPVSPTTDNINGAQVSLSGKLVLVNKEWVVLDQPNREFWIPRGNVLLIRIND